MSAKDEKDTKTKQPQKAPKGTRLPILWETINTFGQIIVTLVGIAVAIISYFHGASFLMSAVRAAVSMMAIGLIIWLVYWMVARGSVDMMKSLYEERQLEIQRQQGVGRNMDFGG